MFSMPLMFFKVFGVQIARELDYRGAGERGGESERERVCVCLCGRERHRERQKESRKQTRQKPDRMPADRQFVK